MTNKRNLSTWLQFLISGTAVGCFAYLFFVGGIFETEEAQSDVAIHGRTNYKPPAQARKQRLQIDPSIHSPVAEALKSLDSSTIRHNLIKIAATHHSQVPKLDEHYYEWIASLPTQHAHALLGLLQKTAPSDWEGHIVTVQKLKPGDRMRYLFPKAIKTCDDPTCLF